MNDDKMSPKGMSKTVKLKFVPKEEIFRSRLVKHFAQEEGV